MNVSGSNATFKIQIKMRNRQNQGTAYEPSGGYGTITITVENGIAKTISGSIHNEFHWGTYIFPADCYVTGVSVSDL